MAAETKVIDGVTYTATDADQTITLTDDAFALVHAITELTKEIRRFRR